MANIKVKNRQATLGKTKKLWTTANLTRMAVLAAVSAVLFMVEIPIVAFYKLDVSNLPVLLAGFAMGPLAGTMVLVVKDLLGLFHSSSMGIGELADFITAFCMLIPAGLIYQRDKSKTGALKGLVAGTISMVIAGVLVNMYVMIPFYEKVMNFPIEAIISQGQKIFFFFYSLWAFVLAITGPFNLLKAIVVSALTFLLYKRLGFLLKDKGY